ncbi:phosphoenolpyruvate synthase/pyruvate phosphate dikinase [Desulfosporosinus orientis DSM 765]|uniref:Phosphoenolpyruvate synthase/pyruvate phosphate dikinase n=1 Tax=Desulfosporosinus orientis (strain ATCC 19365 / DSM 765 / NCIMB 8382 / VKM B-1628 / Singapore I) TaxID=768706 RepID=G7WJ91_DESOD|nr:PEP/pyruvate-binding domain-containing protein [Desulfosporosinus orientis]AET69750.1 phosphoenolpyruvate synthase/pyruvate phosphate dikinase [Desulfosporosinus orientis DSM 765]
MTHVYMFNELSVEKRHLAGGKGGTLAFLFQKGYVVPNGFVILPSAYKQDELTPEAWKQIKDCLAALRKDCGDASFAVRSSGLAEDSIAASFAGQFDTVLNLHLDDEIKEGIETVRHSRYSKEVQSYSDVKGIDGCHDMSVVVQIMVQAEISGVLFTANPVTVNRHEMSGNFVFGLGEDLVSGKVNPYTFTLDRTRSIQTVPKELERFAHQLLNLGKQLEKELKCPQDIEWAIADKRLYVLQSRPITTLIGYNPTTGEWNDSATGNFLWSNVNFGEAIPEVMTPLTWTVQREIYESWALLPGYPSSGNIGGRIYLNLSIYASIFHSLRRSKDHILRFLEGLLYTQLPEGVDIPIIKLPKLSMLLAMCNLVKMVYKQRQAQKTVSTFLKSNAQYCERMQAKIKASPTNNDLSLLWQRELLPHLKNTVWFVMSSVTQFSNNAMKLRREMTELVGADDADRLISGLSSSISIDVDSELLESLGPVLGISKIAAGQISRTDYLRRYGHRGPNEFELSVPRPAEDANWFDDQLNQFDTAPIDVEAILRKRQSEFEITWSRFETEYPRKAKSKLGQIKKIAAKGRIREAVRSEYVRDRWLARCIALRAGELTGLGEDIFFLTINELMDVLSGDQHVLKFISARKLTYQKYCALPAYPSVISGRFDPYEWTLNPNRRNDFFDAKSSNVKTNVEEPNTNTIVGSPGSAGRLEGIVRCLKSIAEGDQLQKGEILVTSQTDIAWTPLFPRACAIITDVGAPLSHAAVIARELGIPAVLGCGNAMMRLKTGDRVLVDGGRGIVVILGND